MAKPSKLLLVVLGLMIPVIHCGCSYTEPTVLPESSYQNDEAGSMSEETAEEPADGDLSIESTEQKNDADGPEQTIESVSQIEWKDELKKDADYEYKESADGRYVSIEQYIGSDTDVDIPEKIDGKTVVQFGTRAFNSETKLKSIRIPDSVKVIGEDCFAAQTELETIRLPAGLTEIPVGAFFNCPKMKMEELPDTIETIGEYAFYSCNEIRITEIPDSVKQIGENAFKKCESITEITFPDGMTILPTGIFAECVSLKKVVLPESVVEIGEEAFYKTAFTGFDFPESVKKIGVRVLSGCEGLESVNLARVEELGSCAFMNCKNLKNVVFTESQTVLPDAVFESCEALETVMLPSTIREIRNSAFESCEKLTDIELPEGLELLGEEAFKNCRSLGQIRLPSTIKQYGDDIFEYCSALKEITVAEHSTIAVDKSEKKRIGASYDCEIKTYKGNDSGDDDIILLSGQTYETYQEMERLKDLYDECFYKINWNSAGIESNGEFTYKKYDKYAIIMEYIGDQKDVITVPDTIDGCTVIGIGSEERTGPADNTYSHGAFYRSSAVEIVLPDTILNIAESAFEDCNELKRITLPRDLVIIENRAFSACSEMEECEFGSYVREIGYYAFSYTGLRDNIKLPPFLETIGYGAFSLCNHITGMEIPQSVTKIESGAFGDCPSLQNIAIYDQSLLTNEVFNYAKLPGITLLGNSESDTETVVAPVPAATLIENTALPMENSETLYLITIKKNGDLVKEYENVRLTTFQQFPWKQVVYNDRLIGDILGSVEDITFSFNGGMHLIKLSREYFPSDGPNSDNVDDYVDAGEAYYVVYNYELKRLAEVSDICLAANMPICVYQNSDGLYVIDGTKKEGWTDSEYRIAQNVKAFSISPNGNYVVYNDKDGNAFLWDSANASQTGIGANAEPICVDDRGNALLLSENGDVKTVLSYNGNLNTIGEIENSRYTVQLAVNRDGSEVIFEDTFFKNGQLIANIYGIDSFNPDCSRCGIVYDMETFVNAKIDSNLVMYEDGRCQNVGGLDFQGKTVQMPDKSIIYSEYDRYSNPENILWISSPERSKKMIIKSQNAIEITLGKYGFYHNMYDELHYRSYLEDYDENSIPGDLVDEKGYQEIFILENTCFYVDKDGYVKMTVDGEKPSVLSDELFSTRDEMFVRGNHIVWICHKVAANGDRMTVKDDFKVLLIDKDGKMTLIGSTSDELREFYANEDFH